MVLTGVKGNLHLHAARLLNRFSEPIEQSGDRIGWEYHNVTLARVPGYGFGIAISGGRDNPHFMHGDPSIAISDVLKAGPAEGRLQVNDRIVSANGISLENVDYSEAVQVLRECGSSVNLLVKRRVFLPPPSDIVKITMTRDKKKDLGIVVGCRFYIKELTGRNVLTDKDSTAVQEGDVITKINGVSITDNMTLKEVKKLLESSKEKVNLVVKRDSVSSMVINNNTLSNRRHGGVDGNRFSIYENGGTSGVVSGPGKDNLPPHAFDPTRPQFWTQGNQNVYVQPPTRTTSGVNNLSQPTLSSSTAPPTSGQQQVVNLSRQPSNVRPQPPPPPPHVSHSNYAIHHHLQQSAPVPPYMPPPVPASSRPPPPIPNQGSSHPPETSRSRRSSANVQNQQTTSTVPPSDPRMVSFKKDSGSVGIRLTGGNETGVFVSSVQPGSPASAAGLLPGDKILKVNGTDLKGKTREEAVMLLLSVQEKVDLLVHHRKSEYETIVNSGKGDSFHIKTHFDYTSSTKGDLSFHSNEVFHVTDTLFNGSVGSWLVHRLGRNNQPVQKGTIPHLEKADELANEQAAERARRSDSEGRGSFFLRRRSARRSKSFSRGDHEGGRRHHYEESIYESMTGPKFPAYERVSLKHPGFIRPLIILGPLADIAREKLLREYPDKYAVPATELDDHGLPATGEPQGASPSRSSVKGTSTRPTGLFRLSSIREIIEKGKHPLLDVTPQVIERLNYAQFYPIVIYMRAESKTIVKELRARHSRTSASGSASSNSNVRVKSSRKLFERAVKLEKHWSYLFTSTIALTGADMWWKKLRETIERQQQMNVWLSDGKPEEIISDDFLFPMTSRLSYASSLPGESDVEEISNVQSVCPKVDDDEVEDKKRLVKASSDPSIAQSVEEGSPTSNAQVPSTSTATKSPSHHRQLPLHLMLRKEISRALKRDSKAEKHQSIVETTNNINNIDTTATTTHDLDAEEYYGTPAKDFAGLFPSDHAINRHGPPSDHGIYSANEGSGSGVCGPPRTPTKEKTGTLTSDKGSVVTTSSTPSSPTKMSMMVSASLVTTVQPPRIDRAKKPERFKSAHERLFGGKRNEETNGYSHEIGRDEHHDNKRDSMTSPEYMNSSSFSLPPVTSANNSSILNGHSSYSFYSRNGTTGTPGTVASPSTPSSSHDMRTKYQSFLSDLIRTTKDPPPPPPKPSSSTTYQPIYGQYASRLTNPPPPPPPINSGSSGRPPSISMNGIPVSSLFPPPPPATPPPSNPKGHNVNPMYSSNWNGHEVNGVTNGYREVYSSPSKMRLPPPSAQDLLTPTRRPPPPPDSDAEVSEILSRTATTGYDIRSAYYS